MKKQIKNKWPIALLIFIIFFTIAVRYGNAQIYISDQNTISFFSDAPLEDIEAKNEKVAGYINLKTGEIKCHVPIKGFVFEKALMQQHFNEQYMESDKYPYAIFIGKFKDAKKLLNKENGNYQIIGDITIHGVKKPFEETVQVFFVENNLLGKTKFEVKVADHNIKIPKLVIKNIAEIIEVTVSLNLKQTNNE